MLSLSAMRITLDPFHFLFFARQSKKNKSFLAVVANRFHQQIAKKYCHGVNLVNFSLHFLKFLFYNQRVTHHLQSDVNFYFWLKASEGPVQQTWHEFYTQKTTNFFPAQQTSPKSTLGFLKVLTKGSPYIREISKRQKDLFYQHFIFYQPKVTPSRSNTNVIGSEIGPTDFPNRIFVQRLTSLKAYSKRHRIVRPLPITPYGSVSASGAPAARGIKLLNIQKIMMDNPENCGIVIHSFRQKWPVFHDRLDGKGLGQYFYFSPGADLMTITKKTPLYKKFSAIENFNISSRSTSKARISHTFNDQRPTNFLAASLFTSGSLSCGGHLFRSQFAEKGINRDQNISDPVPETPSHSLTRTYDGPQKRHKTHFKDNLNPEKAAKSFAIDKHTSKTKYPYAYLPENEGKKRLQSFDRPAQARDRDWLAPKQLFYLRPMISSAAYNKGQQSWVGGRPLGFPPIANKLENRKVPSKAFFSAADQRIDSHGSDGKDFPRMRLLNLSQSAALIQKTDKKKRPEVVANPPMIGANVNALPSFELNGLVDRVYAKIFSRIKRERELRGR